MKNKYVLSLVLLVSVAQNVWSMEEENDNPEISHINVNQNFTIKRLFTAGIQSIQGGFNLGFNYINKQMDPVSYATSSQNLDLVKFATAKFNGVQSAKDLIPLYSFVPTKDENQTFKGNLIQKVHHRYTALHNIMIAAAVKKSNEEDELEKKKLDTEQKHYLDIKQSVYVPAMQSIDKAFSVIIPENSNSSFVIQEKEDKN